MIEEAINLLDRGQDLSGVQMQQVMEEIMLGQVNTAAIVSFLKGLSRKGETAEEITAAVVVMRRHATKIQSSQRIILDTCGTGGDTKGTFNVSTVSAFVACACGITVAKHGNRSVSSSSGSADILEALGVNIELTPKKIEKCLKEIGIAFLFAPALHPAMKYAAAARKEIGKRTIFNLIGPLANPAEATHQLIGVFAKDLTEIFAEVLAGLGIEHALVVYGEDGLDEITTTAPTYICQVRQGEIEKYTILPEDFGFKRASLKDLSGGSAKENAAILEEILKGKPGPRQDIVLFNAAAAVYAADKAESIKAGLTLAKEAINSGRAWEKLELLKKYSLKK